MPFSMIRHRSQSQSAQYRCRLPRSEVHPGQMDHKPGYVPIYGANGLSPR